MRDQRHTVRLIGSALWAGGHRNHPAHNALFVVGALGVAASAYVHLHLWMNGYSVITTIGPLFLVQYIAGFVLAGAVVLSRRVVVGLAAAAFEIGTATGFWMSVHWSLFGFRDAWSAPYAQIALWDEIGSAVVLATVALSCVVSHVRRPASPPRAADVAQSTA